MDLLLQNGDLILVQTTDGSVDLLEFSSSLKEETDLIEKAVMTPLGYIKKYYLLKQELYEIDTNFGSGLYTELAKPFNVSWLANCKVYITEALKQLSLSGSIKNVEVLVTGYNSVAVNIYYKDTIISVTI